MDMKPIWGEMGKWGDPKLRTSTNTLQSPGFPNEADTRHQHSHMLKQVVLRSTDAGATNPGTSMPAQHVLLCRSGHSCEMARGHKCWP